MYEKNKLKQFLQRILQEIKKKDNTWNIRCLVDESFVPSAQQTSVLDCQISNNGASLPGLTPFLKNTKRFCTLSNL